MLLLLFLVWCPIRPNVFLLRPDVLLYLDRFGPDLGPSDPPDEQQEEAGNRPARSPKRVTGLDALAALVTWEGGQLADSLHWRVTHVVVDPGEEEEGGRLPESQARALRERLKQLRRHAGSRFERRVVGPEWVRECVRQGRVVAPEPGHLVRL